MKDINESLNKFSFLIISSTLDLELTQKICFNSELTNELWFSIKKRIGSFDSCLFIKRNKL